VCERQRDKEKERERKKDLKEREKLVRKKKRKALVSIAQLIIFGSKLMPQHLLLCEKSSPN